MKFAETLSACTPDVPQVGVTAGTKEETPVDLCGATSPAQSAAVKDHIIQSKHGGP